MVTGRDMNLSTLKGGHLDIQYWTVFAVEAVALDEASAEAVHILRQSIHV